MKLEKLSQAPLNTTFMGVIRGVFNYYGIAASDSILFGASGHGFAINIHTELCPSGPYCWNNQPVMDLLQNLGVRMDSLGYFSAECSLEVRRHVEGLIRMHLEGGHPCSLMNLENQLIYGFDENGFLVAQPWPGMDFPPKSLAFGTWHEMGDEIHVEFYSFMPTSRINLDSAIEQSLRYAVRVWRGPELQTSGPYGFGPDAYENWRNAIQAGFGTTHGNWWNGTVWSECRRYLAGYFQEVGLRLVEPRLGEDLSKNFATIADLLAKVAEKDRATEDQIEKLHIAQATEETSIARIESYLRCIEPPTR